MINRLEIHNTWNDVVPAWKMVWQDCHDLERWAAFMLQCDRLLALAKEEGLTELEDALRPLAVLLANVKEPGEQQKSAVDLLLPHIFAVVRDACSLAPRRLATTSPIEDDALPLVVMLTPEPDSVQDLLLQMEHYGYAFKVFSNYREGLQAALNLRAVAVVMEIGNGLNASLAQFADQICRKGIKWFAMSRKGDFALRLQAVRHGAQGFFLEPLTINALVDAVDPLAYMAKEDPYRVLALDDSATVLASIQKALEQIPNLSLRTIRQPDLVLETLLDFSPDVLLLDFHMQGCNGLEVAKIIRQNKAFESIPIVYLTSETSEDVQLEAMRHGGDDFLTKPISQAQLVNTVISKAERYRGLRKLMVEDSLTGLFNHIKTKALLQQALLQGERQQLPVCYAILDLDHFKRVNDTYGHTVGDRVLKTLARYLKQRLRRADVVGRYGGEEFVVVFFEASQEQALERLNSIREGFAQIYHAYDEGIFSVTFSAGLAAFPGYTNMMELMVAADNALYAAKRAGRNCVVPASRSGA
ncbi:diguanylate cyclase [Uliginosibacterium sp. 31-16]|uniref:GGDEF domain-containing protein n=1 Tax=Uliginosibacterium sp. 31-16 TaxID=3068315 RepID=UPI00273EC55A|nr:diguanylate cyclase [Uliginosibacterium sp. 31-16]MDP5240282.1 diguanylate cyclase [Uliginosibacterium sp. 31-16]